MAVTCSTHHAGSPCTKAGRARRGWTSTQRQTTGAYTRMRHAVAQQQYTSPDDHPATAEDLQRRGRPRVPHSPPSGGHESRTRQIPHETLVVAVTAVPVTSAELVSRAGRQEPPRAPFRSSGERADGRMTPARRGGPGGHRKCRGGAQERATRAGVRPKLTRSGPGVAALARRVSGLRLVRGEPSQPRSLVVPVIPVVPRG
jgi:hypothetical protein